MIENDHCGPCMSCSLHELLPGLSLACPLQTFQLAVTAKVAHRAHSADQDSELGPCLLLSAKATAGSLRSAEPCHVAVKGAVHSGPHRANSLGFPLQTLSQIELKMSKA